jgi:putative protease
VGIVTNYYGKPGVAEVQVQDHAVALGDSVMFQGPTTGVVEQSLDSMQIHHGAVDKVDKGNLVAIKTVKPVRRNDKLYVVVEQNPEV